MPRTLWLRGVASACVYCAVNWLQWCFVAISLKDAGTQLISSAAHQPSHTRCLPCCSSSRRRDRGVTRGLGRLQSVPLQITLTSACKTRLTKTMQRPSCTAVAASTQSVKATHGDMMGRHSSRCQGNGDRKMRWRRDRCMLRLRLFHATRSRYR